MSYSFLSLGSNEGLRETNLRSALDKLGESCVILKESSIIETSPWGRKAQPKFLNMAALVSTNLSPLDLLGKIKTIERSIGRENYEYWGGRPIDIDILTFDSVVMRSRELSIAHPLMHRRAFVLAPLAELAPVYVPAGFDASIVELKEALDESY